MQWWEEATAEVEQQYTLNTFDLGGVYEGRPSGVAVSSAIQTTYQQCKDAMIIMEGLT